MELVFRNWNRNPLAARPGVKLVQSAVEAVEARLAAELITEISKGHLVFGHVKLCVEKDLALGRSCPPVSSWVQPQLLPESKCIKQTH